MNKLKQWWKAETPKVSRFFQLLSVGLAALPTYYSSLPVDWQVLPEAWKLKVTIVGGVTAFILQFTVKKSKS